MRLSLKWHQGLILIAFVLAGLILRWPETSAGLPAARFSDSAQSVDAAENLAHKWKQGIFAVDPKTYLYPTLYTNTLAVTRLFFSKWGSRERTGRLLTSMYAGLTPVVVFFIAASLASTTGGIVAAALTAFGFLFILQGRYPTPDSCQMLFFSGGLFFLLRNKKISWRDFIWSGVLIGLATGAKYTALLFAAPILLLMMLNPQNNFENESLGKNISGWAAAFLFGFLVAVPSFPFRFHEFAAGVLLNMKIQKSGALIAFEPHFWDYLFSSGTGGSDRPYPNSLWGVMGPMYTLLSCGALGWAFIRGYFYKDQRIQRIAVSIVANYIYFSCSSRIHVIRFLLPMVVMINLLLAVGIEDLVSFLKQGGWKEPPGLTHLLLAIILLAPSARLSIGYLKKLSEKDSRVNAANWLLMNIPRGTKILNFMHGPALPPKQFNLIDPRLPEYRLEISDPPPPAFTLEDLKKNEIGCVIWNDFYWHDLDMPTPNSAVAKYLKGWDQFHRNLLEGIAPRSPERFPGVVSPNIEIYCDETKSWGQARP